MELQSLVIMVTSLIVALSIHEFAHAAAAEYLGDPTARLKGRLTLNPIAHLDIAGSIVFIITLAGSLASGSNFVFGWGKPVPVDPYNLDHPKRDMAIIAIVGPVSNFITAVILSIALHLIQAYQFLPAVPLIPFFVSLLMISVTLGVFNLIPIPPLDGSRIMSALLPDDLSRQYNLFLSQFGFIVLLMLLYTNIIGLILHPVTSSILRILLPGN